MGYTEEPKDENTREHSIAVAIEEGGFGCYKMGVKKLAEAITGKKLPVIKTQARVKFEEGIIVVPIGPAVKKGTVLLLGAGGLTGILNSGILFSGVLDDHRGAVRPATKKEIEDFILEFYG